MTLKVGYKALGTQEFIDYCIQRWGMSAVVAEEYRDMIFLVQSLEGPSPTDPVHLVASEGEYSQAVTLEIAERMAESYEQDLYESNLQWDIGDYVDEE